MTYTKLLLIFFSIYLTQSLVNATRGTEDRTPEQTRNIRRKTRKDKEQTNQNEAIFHTNYDPFSNANYGFTYPNTYDYGEASSSSHLNHPDLNAIYNPVLNAVYHPDLNAVYNPDLNTDYNSGLNAFYNQDTNAVYNPNLYADHNSASYTAYKSELNSSYNTYVNADDNIDLNVPHNRDSSAAYSSEINTANNAVNNAALNQDFNTAFNQAFDLNAVYEPSKTRDWRNEQKKALDGAETLELVKQFLLEQGFQNEEVSMSDQDVTDNLNNNEEEYEFEEVHDKTVPNQTCTKCKANLGNVENDLVKHTQTCPEIATNKKKIYGCYCCPLQTDRRDSMKKHIRSHSGYCPFECDFCGFSCIDKRILNRHFKNYHTTSSRNEVQNQVCTKCNANLGVKEEDLVIHTKRCKEIAKFTKKKFGCYAVCPYATNLRDSMRRHIRTHTGNNPFKCPLCSFGSKQRKNMIPHLIRIHKCNVSQILRDAKKVSSAN